MRFVELPDRLTCSYNSGMQTLAPTSTMRSRQTGSSPPGAAAGALHTAPSGLRIAALLACLVGVFASPPAAPAQTLVEVDVELMLAVDVSYSMTAEELEIQRHGYAAALSDPAIWQAIATGRLRRIALTYVEWAGAGRQRVVIPWRLIRSAADLTAFAATLSAHSSGPMVRTSISGMLDAASASFDGNAFDGSRRVIDVSGDGPNNEHRPVTTARDDLVAKGYTINGLPLMTRRSAGWLPELDDLDLYYQACVIGGPLSFSIPVRSWQEFIPAVRQKLVLELAAIWSGPKIVKSQWRGATADGYDCLIGEKMWERFIGDRYE